MSDCVFCAISAGDAERSVVYEDEACIAIMDISPVNRGHVLVIPRRHAAGLHDLAHETAAHVFTTAMRVAAAMRRSPIEPEGINLFLADGEAAGQEVFHVHLHVLPRFRGDGLRIERAGAGSIAPRDELDQAASAIREALA
jgi:diadenosine tetraphosphate (Ap4A) HIT family hydrolase